MFYRGSYTLLSDRGASAAAAAGIPYFVIQALGRWKSDSFKRYIRLSPDYIGGGGHTNYWPNNVGEMV